MTTQAPGPDAPAPARTPRPKGKNVPTTFSVEAALNEASTDVLDPFLVGAAVHHGRQHNPRERPEVPWFEVFQGKGAPGPGERGFVDPLAIRALDKPRIVNVAKDEAFAFVRAHHSALPEPNPRGLLYAIGVQVRGRLVAVALANTPAARYEKRACSVDGIVDLSRIASDGSTLGASSMLAARLIDVLERSGRRGVPGCLFVTQSLLTEAGTTYLALADKGLRPVALARGKTPSGARKGAGLRALPHLPKIVWEAGPAALPPDWEVLAKTSATEKQIAGARKQWEAWHAREELARKKREARAASTTR